MPLVVSVTGCGRGSAISAGARSPAPVVVSGLGLVWGVSSIIPALSFADTGKCFDTVADDNEAPAKPEVTLGDGLLAWAASSNAFPLTAEVDVVEP